MNEVEKFLTHHNACEEGLEWAVENCKNMQEVWDTAKPEWLVWLATREGVMSPQQQRKFACWSVRQIWQMLTDERSRNAVEVAEKYADGLATDGELAAAWDAARVAARDAAWSAARSASRSAARDAARDVPWASQAKWLRDNVTPNFTLEEK